MERLRVTRAEGVVLPVEEEVRATDWNHSVEELKCPDKEFQCDPGEGGRHCRLLKREMPHSDIFLSGTRVGGMGGMEKTG